MNFKKVSNKIVCCICLYLTIFMFIYGLLFQNSDATAFGVFNMGVSCAVLIWYGTKNSNNASSVIRLMLSFCTALSAYTSLVWVLWRFGFSLSIGAIQSGAIESSFPVIMSSWILVLMAYWGYKNEF